MGTNIQFELFLLILVIHFLADFCLQTVEQATNKYKGGIDLFNHCLTYSLAWIIPAYIFIDNWEKVIGFVILTFCFHYLTDLITSNVGKAFWDKKDFHNGFVVVGFDQILHYIQLILTFQFFMS